MAKLSQKEIDALNKKFKGMSKQCANDMAKNYGTSTKKVTKKKATKK